MGKTIIVGTLGFCKYRLEGRCCYALSEHHGGPCRCCALEKPTGVARTAHGVNWDFKITEAVGAVPAALAVA